MLAKLSQLLHARGRPDEAEEIYLALALSDQPSAASPPSGSEASPPKSALERARATNLSKVRGGSATNLSKAAERAAQAKPTKEEGGDNARPANEGALEVAVA